MELQEIDLNIGRKCQLVDSTGAFVDGNVSETDVVAFVNNRYRQLYLKLVDKYPFLGQYNETLDLDEDVEFYSFSDLTESQLELNYVGIKYASTDPNYTKVKRREKNRLFKNNTGKTGYDKTKPFYNFSKDPVSGETGIVITPTPDADVTDGLYVEYVVIPDVLLNITDTPNLPFSLQDVLIAYGVADVWEAKRDWSNSNQALNRAMLLEKEFFENYNPKASDEPVRFSPNKTFNPFNR